jgi:hypothetical protein
MKYLKYFKIFESLTPAIIPKEDYTILSPKQDQPKKGNGQGQPEKGNEQGQLDQPKKGNGQGQPEKGNEQGQLDQPKKGNEQGKKFKELINPEDVEKAEATMQQDAGESTKRRLGTIAGKMGQIYQSKRALGAPGTLKEVSSIWEKSMKQLISSGFGGLSEKARSLIQRILDSPPRVDWKKELARLYDRETRKIIEKLPNRRMLGLPGSPIMYGRKRAGQEGFKTAVYIVDTSGSISEKQSNVFLEEMMRLNKKFEIDETLIIYCSDNIDNWEIVKKGKQPNLKLWATTGGNRNGFGPPFKLIEELKKKPSFVCYFTDTMADFPKVDQYGISKYEKKVYWFICKLDKGFTIPPFGNYVWIPMDSKGNTI